MKLLKSLTLVVAAGLMITAYGKAEKGLTPSEVVKKFTEATINFDFAKAKEYVSTNVQSSYDEIIAHFELPELKEQLEMIKNMAKDVKVDIIEEKIEDDVAHVTIKIHFGGDEEDREDVVNLIKEENEWKINESRIFL